MQELRGGRTSVRLADGGFSTPCWLWLGSINSRGYGIRGVGEGRRVLVHRAVYEHVYGELTQGDQIHHLCERKPCVRPDHLAARTPFAHAREHFQRPTLDSVVAVLRLEPGLGPTAIAARAGLNRDSVGVAVQRGVAYGLIRRVRYGVYEAAA